VVARSHVPEAQPGGRVVVVQRTPQYLRTRITGHFDVRAARALITVLDDWSRNRTHLTAFHDCAGVVDYDVEARELVMRWSGANVAGFDAVHLLVENRIIDLLLKVIGAVLPGKLVSHRTRFSFDAANARHIDR